MSTEAIQAKTFIRDYTPEILYHNAAVFAGAGLSVPAGYVNWRGLLRDIIHDLHLDPDKEHDLVTIAQYSCNQRGGKTHLTQTIVNHFQRLTPTENHRILARLPIQTYWTTNYDRLLETALEEAKKVVDAKTSPQGLSSTTPNRNVAVYKMHGDIGRAHEAIISKDDYEAYPSRMAGFVTALKGDLVEKTFLFLGFSFSDPNIDYILSRVRVQNEGNARHHYCIQRKVSPDPGESAVDFKHRELKQDYFIRDLKRFGIMTVLVDEYSHITELLRQLETNFKRRSIFISGSASEYAPIDASKAQNFVHDLSRSLSCDPNRLITGFGLGIGGMVINGVLSRLSAEGKTISDDKIMMRPFPQVATGTLSLPAQWRSYREAMLEHAGIAVFLFGNKTDAASGKTVLANGMREEFDIAVAQGVKPLPVGATGFMAKELWTEVWSDFDKFYPNASAEFKSTFEALGDSSTPLDALIKGTTKLVTILQQA